MSLSLTFPTQKQNRNYDILMCEVMYSFLKRRVSCKFEGFFGVRSFDLFGCSNLRVLLCYTTSDVTIRITLIGLHTELVRLIVTHWNCLVVAICMCITNYTTTDVTTDHMIDERSKNRRP